MGVSAQGPSFRAGIKGLRVQGLGGSSKALRRREGGLGV